MLDLVGMDPSAYRGRYPKELSGGQRQRIGVARALAADPPVMLMDEPFGAVDPIAREKLQNEFLRLQEDIGKTIVFVTHDIDEAIKMGDRIAVLREQSVIAQFDTPERILADPADAFVAEFIGAGASLKRLGLARVRDFALAEWPVSASPTAATQPWRRCTSSRAGWVLLLDDGAARCAGPAGTTSPAATEQLDRVGIAGEGGRRAARDPGRSTGRDGVQPGRRCRRRRRPRRLHRHRRHGRDHGGGRDDAPGRTRARSRAGAAGRRDAPPGSDAATRAVCGAAR